MRPGPCSAARVRLGPAARGTEGEWQGPRIRLQLDLGGTWCIGLFVTAVDRDPLVDQACDISVSDRVRGWSDDGLGRRGGVGGVRSIPGA